MPSRLVSLTCMEAHLGKREPKSYSHASLISLSRPPDELTNKIKVCKLEKQTS